MTHLLPPADAAGALFGNWGAEHNSRDNEDESEEPGHSGHMIVCVGPMT